MADKAKNAVAATIADKVKSVLETLGGPAGMLPKSLPRLPGPPSLPSPPRLPGPGSDTSGPPSPPGFKGTTLLIRIGRG